MTHAMLIAGAILLVFGWLPIMLHFWRGWRGRKNPISLAIVALVLFISATGINAAIYPCQPARVIAWLSASAAVLANFYWTIRLARERFADRRGRD